jgi:asparagine synthase (glutamine-hydrolysing)
MCGIAGIINFSKDSEIDIQSLERMAKSIEHRGMDGSGIFKNKNVGLAHKRLSIIDLSIDSNQPFKDNKEEITIVFNGEIYNFIELKARLKSKYTFYTNSDTEVIIKSYLEWGEKCVEYFNGMWSFVIVDQRVEEDLKILCSRDRMGIKPFYYYLDEDSFVFCSELKAFINNNDLSIDLNINALWDYFVFGSAYYGETVLNNVHELKPGTNVLIQNGQVEFRSYFNLLDTFSNQTNKYDYRQIKELIEKAINLRLRSDVPIASINSGGLDSSLVSAIARTQVDELFSYSAAPNRENNLVQDGDESTFAEEMAKYIGTNHSTIYYSQSDYNQYIQSAVNFNDGQLFHPNSVAMDIMFRRIKSDGKTVVLGGEGADEVFRGYSTNKMFYILNSLDPISSKLLLKKRLNKGYLLDYLKSPVIAASLLKSTRISPERANEILGINGEPLASRLEVFEQMSRIKASNALAYYEQTCFLSGVLRRADRMSMKHQIELRVPYLDYNIIKYLNGICHRKKTGYRVKANKRILRKIGGYYLPISIVHRKKYGFASPIKNYMQSLESLLIQYHNLYRIEKNNLNLVEKYILATSLPEIQREKLL